MLSANRKPGNVAVGSLSLHQRPQHLHDDVQVCRHAWLAKESAQCTHYLQTENAAIVARMNFNPARISLLARLFQLAGSENGLPRCRLKNLTSSALYAHQLRSKQRSAIVLHLATHNLSVLRGSKSVQRQRLLNKRAHRALLENTLPRQSIEATAITNWWFRAHEIRICRTREV